MIRVAAVDDHPVMLRGLRAMTSELIGRVEFVAYGSTVTELLDSDLVADVVLLDLHLGDGTRPRDNVRRLLAHGLRVLVYTEGDRRAWVSDAIHAGAQGIVLKAQPPEELLAAIETVYSGQPVLSPEMADILRRDAVLRPQLSPRETEALSLVASGLADKQVARVMVISEETVKEYLKRIRCKYAELGRPAASRIDLHRRAIEDGYVDRPGHEAG